MTRAAEGLSGTARRSASDLLQQLARKLAHDGVTRRHEIIRARVPIVKTELLPLDENGRPLGNRSGGRRLSADISIGAANGVAGVALVQRAVALLPSLRPLCLVVKALLKERGLNEVFTGGLSSYMLVNMVLAHLACEGYVIRRVPQRHEEAAGGFATPGTGLPVKRRRRMSAEGEGAGVQEDAAEAEAAGWQDDDQEKDAQQQDEEEWVASDSEFSEDDYGQSSSGGSDNPDDNDLTLHVEHSDGDSPAGRGRADSSLVRTPNSPGNCATPAAATAAIGTAAATGTPAAADGSAAVWDVAKYDHDLARMAETAAAAVEASIVSGHGAAMAPPTPSGLSELQLSYLRALQYEQPAAADLGELLYGFLHR